MAVENTAIHAMNSTMSLRECLLSDGVTLLDVRSAEEVAEHSLSVPFRHCPADRVNEADVTTLLPKKDSPVVVYCAAGVRSRVVADQLTAFGYTKVVNGGGVRDVEKALSDPGVGEGSDGNPLTADTPASPVRPPLNTGRLECVAELEGHMDRVWCVTWSPNGKYLASCSGDKSIRVWGADSTGAWVCLATLEEGQQRTIRKCAWSPDGTFLAAVSFDATTAIWQHVRVPSTDAMDTDDSDEEDGERRMKWVLIAHLEGHENEVKGVCWNADGSLLATCGRDKSVWIWEVIDPAGGEFECLTVLQEHTQDVKSVMFHPREPWLISASYDDTIKIWKEDGDDWISICTLQGHASTVWGFAPCPGPFVPDAATPELLVTVSDDRSLICWEQVRAGAGGVAPSSMALTWKLAQRLNGYHKRAIIGVDWAERGPFPIATCCEDNALRIFLPRRSLTAGCPPDAEDREALFLDSEVLQAHGGDVNYVEWSRHGPGLDLATAGDDGVVKVWRYHPDTTAAADSPM